jgi:transposase-like protein
MSIVKFEVNFRELKKAVENFTENRVKAFENMLSDIKDGIATLINQLLNAEMGVYLGEPEQSDNKRNGYSTKEYALKGIGSLKIKVPIDRKRNFESKIIPKHERMDPRLSEDLAALHLAGLSSRTLSMMANSLELKCLFNAKPSGNTFLAA